MNIVTVVINTEAVIKEKKTFCCISVLQTLGTIESCIIYCIFRNTFKVRLF